MQNEDLDFWKRQAVYYCKAFMKVAHSVELSTEAAIEHIRKYGNLTIDQLSQEGNKKKKKT
jgi:hypothetical protein